MSASNLSTPPPVFKSLHHYLKTAAEHDQRDPVIAYYCRLYALQRGMEIDKSSRDARTFLLNLMECLEQTKKQNAEQDAIQNDVVGQAHIEDYALRMFLHADNEDRAGKFSKNLVKAFYKAGILFDVLTNFGDLSEDLEKNRKYAKWKAAYIHRCLKDGDTPIPGPVGDEFGDGDLPVPGTSGSVDGGAVPPADKPEVPPASEDFHLPTVPDNLPGVPATTPTVPPSTHVPATTPVVPPNTATGSRGGSGGATAPAAQWQPPPTDGADVDLTPAQMTQAMKYCKYAGSALQYDDKPTAIDNLNKALKLLTTGHE